MHLKNSDADSSGLRAARGSSLEVRQEQMNGLRIYTDLEPADKLQGRRVFYSRRANGPLYCWRYEEKSGGWRGSRMQSDLNFRHLSVASWKGVPAALQVRLGEHYLE